MSTSDIDELRQFAAKQGKWANVTDMLFKTRDSAAIKKIVAEAEALKLFTYSTGSEPTHELHVLREKPAPPPAVKRAPASKPRADNMEWGLRQFAPEVFHDPLWSGGSRDYIGDCEDCGVEMWGYPDDYPDEEWGDVQGLRCLRCGGDDMSKYEFMR